MNSYCIKDIHNDFKLGNLTSFELIKKSIENFENDKKSPFPLNAFLEMYDDALIKAQNADNLIKEAKEKGTEKLDALFKEKPLLGIPFGNKDNISVKGKRLTCASKILEGYIAPYDATVISRLKNAGAIPIGRCNQDEFAMGSSTEYSAYGATRNPINREYVSGGSSGGSAAAVAANQALFALGTETGGSVRLPASYCGIYGLKPTYGVLSRWGVTAFASSLDQVGIMGHTPADIALSLKAMCKKDFYDDTSADLPESNNLTDLKPYNSISSLKIAIPRQFLETKGLMSDVEIVFSEVRRWFEDQGAEITVIDIPILEASIASYYVIALAEAASNLSRFDGIRYGRREGESKSYDELYVETRSKGFGAEVKRRIVIGNYVLSEQFSGDTYKKGMAVRALIQKEAERLFETYDMLLCPTCPTPAFKLGQKINSPMEMYLNDLFTIFVNLARITSISVPAGHTSAEGIKAGVIQSLNSSAERKKGLPANAGLPVGVQFIGAMFSEPKILQIAQAWEESHKGCGIPICAD